MARTPSIPEEEYYLLLEEVGRQGYDPADVVKVPQRWE
jgi:lipocalin